jgi:hypothetical protein
VVHPPAGSAVNLIFKTCTDCAPGASTVAQPSGGCRLSTGVVLCAWCRPRTMQSAGAAFSVWLHKSNGMLRFYLLLKCVICCLLAQCARLGGAPPDVRELTYAAIAVAGVVASMVFANECCGQVGRESLASNLFVEQPPSGTCSWLTLSMRYLRLTEHGADVVMQHPSSRTLQNVRDFHKTGKGCV